MRRLVFATEICLCVSSAAAIASADTLTLRDGTRVPGIVVAISDQILTFEDWSGISHRYSTNQVESLEFAATTRRDEAAMRDDRRPRDDRRQRTLPSGTELAVRTAEDIDSATARANQTFSAMVENDIIGDSNDVLLPAGSRAVIVIREVSSGGATGSPEMVLDIQSITLGGRSYVVITTALIENTGTDIGTDKRTAETVGGGAALGTIIGAIAGGAKGAGLGVLIGAAGGAGVEVLNKGRDVRGPPQNIPHVPPTTPLT